MPDCVFFFRQKIQQGQRQANDGQSYMIPGQRVLKIIPALLKEACLRNVGGQFGVISILDASSSVTAMDADQGEGEILYSRKKTAAAEKTTPAAYKAKNGLRITT